MSIESSRVANGKIIQKSNFYERKSMMSRASSVAGVVRRERESLRHRSVGQKNSSGGSFEAIDVGKRLYALSAAAVVVLAVLRPR